MKENNPPETKFTGAVSLDAILASKSNKTNGVVIPEPVIVEPAVAEPVSPIPPADLVSPVKPVAVKPIVAEPVVAEPVLPVAGEETDAFKMAQQFIEMGMLEDFTIQASDKDTEGTLISEFKNMTQDNLEEIVKIHKQEAESLITSNFIPKEGFKEHQLKVIEILKNGGDLSQIADTPDKAFERPFEGFDMDDQKRQIDVRYTDLVSSKGLDHDSAIVIIEKEVKSGEIATKSRDIVKVYRDAHAKFVDDTLADQRKKNSDKVFNFKENKKALVAKLKEQGLKESVYKKVASEYGKLNNNGEYALMDKLKLALEKPEENHELILHLADKKLFNDTFKIKAAQETHKKIVRLASGAEAKGNRKPGTTTPTEIKAPWLQVAEQHNSNLANN